MRILQIISGREVNGALVYCRLLANELTKAGHDVTVICRPGSWLVGQDIEAHRIESDMRRFWSSDLRDARNLIARKNVDIVHTHMSRAHTFGVLLKWITGVPLVATAHNRHLQLHWKFNDYVIANSRATERFQRRCNMVAADRIRPIHCFVDLAKFQHVGSKDRRYVRNELRCTDGQFLVGVVGEVIPRKGQLYLIQGLEELVRRIPNLNVVLLGRFHRSEPYVRRLRRIQCSAGLHRRVRWLGRRSNIHQHMAALDVLVVPSIEEPLGLVAVEAQAAGTPVVAANTGGLPEIVQHERNGLLVPPANTRALVEAICRVQSDRKFVESIVRNGRADASSNFSPATLTREVTGVYEHVLAMHQRRKAA